MAQGLHRGEAKEQMCRLYAAVMDIDQTLDTCQGQPSAREDERSSRFQKVGRHGTGKSLNSVVWPAGAAENRRKK